MAYPVATQYPQPNYTNPYSPNFVPATPVESVRGSNVTAALQLPEQQDPNAYKTYYYPPKAHTDPRNDGIFTMPGWPPPFVAPNQLDDYGRETDEMRRMYMDLYKKEPALRSAIQGKISAVCSLDISVLPADDSKQIDKDAAQFLHWTVDNIEMGWEGLAQRVLEPACLWGWSFTETILKPEEASEKYGGYWSLRDAKSKDTSHLRLRLDTYRNVAGVVSTVRGLTEYPLWKGILYTYNGLFENPFGTSDVRSAYRACQLIDSAYQLWYVALKNFSSPFLQGAFDRPTNRHALEMALQQARAGGYIATPKIDDVKVLNLASATSFDAFEKKVDKMRQEIYLSVRGAYLPFLEGTGNDARGDTKVNKQASNDVEYLLAKIIGRVLTFQLGPKLIHPNFGKKCGLPRVIFGGVNWAETKAQLDAADIVLNKLKLPLSKKWIYTVAQMPSPEDPQDTVAPQGPGMPGAPGLPGAGGPGAPGLPPGPDGGTPPAIGPGPSGSPSPGAGGAGDAGGAGQPAGDQPSSDIMTPDAAGKVADVFAQVPNADPDWTMAVFTAALDDSGHDFDAAVQKTLQVLQQTPQEPQDEGNQFSWSQASTKDGHVKAIGGGPNAGQVLYGTDAERALAAQGKGGSGGQTPSSSASAGQAAPAAGGSVWAQAKAIKNRVASAASTVDQALEGHAGIPYTAIRTAVAKVHHAMSGLMAQTQKLAVQAARERGIPETKVEAISNILAAGDFAMSFALSKGGLVATGGNVAASFAAGMMPSASLGYLAYSTAKNPVATLKAAKKLVQGKIEPVASAPATHSAKFSEDVQDDLDKLPPEVTAAILQLAIEGDWQAVDLLAELASDPEGLYAFIEDDDSDSDQMATFADGGWTQGTTRTGKIKAVWSGGGKAPLYGKAAESALSGKPKGPSTKDILIKRKQEAEPARQKAREAWQTASVVGAQSHEVQALTQHLHNLTRNELREMAAAVEKKVGGLKKDLVDRLVNHARESVLDLGFDNLQQEKAPKSQKDSTVAKAEAINSYQKAKHKIAKAAGKKPPAVGAYEPTIPSTADVKEAKAKDELKKLAPAAVAQPKEPKPSKNFIIGSDKHEFDPSKPLESYSAYKPEEMHKFADLKVDVTEKSRNSAKEYLDKMNSKLRYDVESYTGSAYYELNQTSRKCPPTFECLNDKQKDKFESIEKSINEAPELDQPTTVYRSMNANKDVEAAILKACLFASENDHNVMFPSITSTTCNPKTAGNFGNLTFSIKTKHGLLVKSISEFPDEDEMILSSQAKYKVLKVNKLYVTPGFQAHNIVLEQV